MEEDRGSIDLNRFGDDEERENLLEERGSPEFSSSPSEMSIARPRRSWWRILMDGPEKLVDPHVTMIFPRAQELPHKLWERFSRQSLYIVFWVSLTVWALVFYAIVQNSILASASIDGKPAELIGCNAVPKLWRGKNSACGVDAEDCIHWNTPNSEMRFKCAADCVKESWTYSGTSVGDYESIYRPFVVGGGNGTNYYRGDSFVCGAAAHRGVISDFSGGCGIIKFTGKRTEFPGGSGKHGMESIGFGSVFPESFEFLDTKGMRTSGCHDLRWAVIIVNILISFVYGYLVYDSKAFFWPIFIMGFWTVALASNPPLVLSSSDAEMVVAELVSLSFRRLLPALLAAYVIYVSSVRPQLKGLKANLSRSVFWLIGFWVGVLENYVFGHLPLDRLTPDDMNAQSGAWIAVGIIAGSILAIAFGQAYIIWRMGKFKPYIQLYIGMILGLFVLSLFPNQTLRIHHYIMALCLLPGTGFKTTPSLLYQGILVGLFVSGISRWDFDSIIQTYEQLRRGAPALVGGIPELLDPLVSMDGQNVTLRWTPGNETSWWDRYSLLINDVERYRGPWTNFSLSKWIQEELGTHAPDLKYYIRVAFASKRHTGDYTKAGVIDMAHKANWTKPASGAT